ncbi:PAS domain-containing protein [Marixanthomonas sp. SCSIO 43207]|uniref:LuxR C-terminal-related transcriptional regulator n=1 Tax=Marixanthomonas sp. SCSIO 43207 TaxID=2779360 RepID=UPI001CA94EE9|nr:LuxR C-terminal-related transcriptional regulator [Marixanthomonas sp. SCSIO 43207]UAB80388.1 PAS domain-containing protein [Marixanthomonas sp. SCSIO 43207]
MFKSSKEFVEDIQKTFGYSKMEALDFTKVKNFPLNVTQCLYVIDWQSGSVVYQRNVDKILGYSEEEFTMEKILEIAHPNDIQIVRRATQAIVNHLVENKKMSMRDTSLNITYRFRKKDGTYIKLLRQSSFYSRTPEGKFRSNISLLTDISFFDDSEIVQWDFITPKVDQDELKKRVYEEFSSLFTARELEIIKLLAINLTSNEIAEKLFISPHTVTTHRKNMLQKAQCNNTADLLTFCHKIGVL